MIFSLLTLHFDSNRSFFAFVFAETSPTVADEHFSAENNALEVQLAPNKAFAMPTMAELTLIALLRDPNAVVRCCKRV